MRSTLTFSTCLVLFALASGCKEEPQDLFDETGVWSVEKYAIDGGQLNDVPQERKNAFQANFNPDLGVVAIGSCFSAANQDIDSAICHSNPAAAYWECKCFAYSFSESRMVWQPFEPGQEIPEVGDPELEGSGAIEVTVEEFPELGRGYMFYQIPEGVFSSDGVVSKFVLQQKSLSIWDESDPPGLGECSVACFGE